jgi:hypothetical protein
METQPINAERRQAMLDAIERACARIPAYLQTVRRPDPPYGRYRYYASTPKAWCLYASIEGISMEGLLGLTDRWSVSRRHEVVDLWRGCQQSDGFFRCPCCGEGDGDARQRCAETNADAIAFKVAMTLHLFGAKPRYPLPIGMANGTALLTSDNVERWLAETFACSNPYAAGSMVWKACGPRSLRCLLEGRDPMSEPVVARIMDWLLRHQDPATGLWFPNGDILNGVNGLLKMRYGTFDPAGLDIPQPEAIVAAILGIQRPDGGFGGACCDWNAVGLLADLGRRTPALHERIVDACERVLPVILRKQHASGGFRWDSDADDDLFLKSAAVNLHGLSAIRSFLLCDDPCMDLIFPGRSMRGCDSVRLTAPHSPVPAAPRGRVRRPAADRRPPAGSA